MDFPPLSNLISATFQELNLRETSEPQRPADAPQAVAAGERTEEQISGEDKVAPKAFEDQPERAGSRFEAKA